MGCEGVKLVPGPTAGAVPWSGFELNIGVLPLWFAVGIATSIASALELATSSSQSDPLHPS